ncbi:hypothetical protein ACFQ0X_43710 [Streptomyces rectiviolaceus]|uniref:Uncharacterized protein n=1 Tax=Streptomyces rectiviolaceus TaxID=332591 RepID=A0ABP6NNX9_9ACTN
MDMTEMMTRDGCGEFSSGQRDTFVNDAAEIRQIGLIFKARIAQSKVEGDKPWSAKYRAYKVGKQFEDLARLLEKAAAKCEAVDATYSREVLDLPERRDKALEKKQQRKELRQLTRAKAQGVAAGTLTESARGLAADPRTTGQTPTMPNAVQPEPQYVHPHAYAPNAYAGTGDPLGNITDHFGLPEAM